MQILPLPPQAPLAPAQPAQAVTQVLPHIHGQAAAPQIARAIDPTPQGKTRPKVRSNADRAKGGEASAERQRGGHLNISV